jgi:hypothetical protein
MDHLLVAILTLHHFLNNNMHAPFLLPLPLFRHRLLRRPKPILILPSFFKYDAHTLAPAVWFGTVSASSVEADSSPAITFQNIFNLREGGWETFTPACCSPILDPMCSEDPHSLNKSFYYSISLLLLLLLLNY